MLSINTITFSIYDFINVGKVGCDVGRTLEKNVKNNLAFPNKFYSCKDEFDIVIGNFENNTYLIDTIIEVKNL